MKTLSKLNLLFTLIFIFVNSQVFAQIGGTNTVCSGQTESYTSIGSATTYNWTVSGAISIAKNGSSVTVEWGTGAAGTINLITYDQNGVQTGTHNLSVTINGLPNPVILSSFSTNCFNNVIDSLRDSCFAACQYRSVLYTSPLVTGNSYSWELIGDGSMTIITPNEIEVVWQTIGVHYVKLTVSNGAACSNTFEKCVRVIEAPTAIIGTSPVNSSSITVCKNADVYLQDLSTGSIGRRWDFGDGTFSDKINPSHTYTQAGTYEVILTANNDCFCLNSDTITVTVENTEGPEIVCPAVVCAGDTLSYSTPSSCGSFVWTTTNGTIIGSDSGNTVDVVWNNHVGYIQSVGSNCNTTCNAPSIERIDVVADSIPILGANPVCIGDEQIYSVTPIPGSVYTWTIDQSLRGSLSSNVEYHEYYIKIKKIEGSGNIDISYTNALLGCSGNSTLFVEAKDKLDFPMPSEVCNNDSVEFNVDLPIDWTIIDSTGLVVKSDTDVPAVFYNWSTLGSGKYTLQLRKRNSYCNDLDLPFSILPAPTKPDTIYGENSVCFSYAYSYHVDPKSGHTVEWIIDGGSPTSAVGNVVTVNWNATGPYILRAAYRELADPSCLSDFRIKTLVSAYNGTSTIIAPDSACGGDTAIVGLNFIADDVTWTVIPNYGASIITDRFNSEIRVQLSAASNLTISLKAEGSVCGTPFLLFHDIYIQTFPAPQISFSDPNPCPNSPVTFTTSSPNPAWVINGQSYSASAPTLAFDSAQLVGVKVTAANIGPAGCIIERVNVAQLTVKNNPKAIITAFDTNFTHCKDTLAPIVLSASLQGANASLYNYSWVRDNIPIATNGSNIFTTQSISPHGDYYVIAVAPNGCIDTSEIFTIDSICNTGCSFSPNNGQVSIELTSIGCSEYFISNVNPAGATIHSITFEGKGTTTSTGAYGFGVQLSGAGTQTLRFRGAIDTGTDIICFDTTIVKTVQAIPNFNIVKQDCGNSGFVNYELLNTSTYAHTVPSYTWDYGNGTYVSGTYNRIVSFPPLQTTVKLSVSPSCFIEKTFTPATPIHAAFSSTAPACQQENVDFTNLSVGNIAEYRWVFGFKELFDENPSVTFDDGGPNYSTDFDPFVYLYILDDNGCRDTSIQQISIKGNQFSGKIQPLFHPVICEGNSILLDYSQTSFSNAPINYQWSTLASTPSIQAKQTGNYKLSLTDVVGCRSVTEQVNVQVNTAPNPRIIGKQTFCEGDSIRLKTLNHPSYGLTWLINGSSTSQTSANFSELLTAGSYNISINAISTTSACPSINPPFPITVLAKIPKPVITPSASNPLCEGSPIALNANPTGANFFWNTGQTGNSITQSLAGKYTVFQTDISGCQASESINIHPLPDFSNFMEGCYCLPSVNPPNLPGIANMASYQWIKNGVLVPPSAGIMQNLPASEGSFELIATTNSGCVDTARYMDITFDGCEDCELSLSDFIITCTSVSNDSIYYDFTLNADIDNANAFYNLGYDLSLNNQPVSLLQVQPSSISGIRNGITGSFVLTNSNAGDSLCIQLTASNPGVNCSATICIPIAPLACDIVPNFTYSINPYTCLLELEQSALFGNCTSSDSVIYSWTVTQGGNVYTGIGDSISIDSLQTGNAVVCMQMQVFNAADSSFCLKDTCMTIVVPDCSCKDDCTVGASASFTQFIQQGSSCIVEFKIVIANPLNNFVSVNHLQTSSGTILSIVPTTATPNTLAFLVQYLPDSSQCVNQCFELFLNDGGTNCCVNFCVDLPQCSCNLTLSKLNLSCGGAGSANGWYDFKFFADIDACNGFTYDVSQLTVRLNNIAANVVTYNPTSIVNGKQLIIGTVDLSGLSGRALCFDMTASLGGIECSETICKRLPTVPCELTPSFTSDFDPTTCTLTLTNTSTVGVCTVLDTNNIVWSLNYNGQTLSDTGQTVKFFNISEDSVNVCLLINGTDYSGNISCTDTLCQDINIPSCECENNCNGLFISSANFLNFIQPSSPCTLQLELVINNALNSSYQITTMLADKGSIVNYSLLSSQNGLDTYQVNFTPDQAWNGGTVCFDVFLRQSNGVICCVQICVDLPKCDCGLNLSGLMLDCTGPNGTQGDFTFSFNADLDGTVGYTYATSLTATFNGSPVTISSFQPTSMIDGIHSVSGSISLPQGLPGDTLCFTLTASLGGRTCSAIICDTLPDDDCVIVPSFTWAIDPVTCAVTFTSTSTIGSCTYVSPSSYSWTIMQNGNTYGGFGNPFVEPNLSNGNTMVCLSVNGLNYTNTQDCHPEICIPISIPACPSEEEEGEEPEERKKGIEGQKTDINTYPNPAKNALFIEWKDALNESVKIKLVDHQSKVVLTETRAIQGRITELDLNNYADGVYVLEVIWRTQITRKKIVILK